MQNLKFCTHFLILTVYFLKKSFFLDMFEIFDFAICFDGIFEVKAIIKKATTSRDTLSTFLTDPV